MVPLVQLQTTNKLIETQFANKSYLQQNMTFLFSEIRSEKGMLAKPWTNFPGDGQGTELRC